MATSKGPLLSSWSSRKEKNLLSSLFTHQLIPERSGLSWTHNPAYRSLIRKSYRRVSRIGRKVFKTGQLIEQWNVAVNPVYDIAYSPVGYQNFRVIAVADELGFLSIVKVPFEGAKSLRTNKTSDSCTDGVRGLALDDRAINYGAISCGIDHDESTNPPVLYSLAWNSEGNRIATGYGDGSMRIWDLEKASEPTCVSTIFAYEKGLKRVALSEGLLISCSRTNEILVHDQRMRIPLANRIDCSLLNSKLTDISVLSEFDIVASSSNHSDIHHFDLRYTYKLYKRLKPVEIFHLPSPGYTTMKYDKSADDGNVYALGSDSIVRSFNYRTGDVGSSYLVPGGVDFFSKIDVDSFTGILVSGGRLKSAWGFDLLGKAKDEECCNVKPFVELREGRRPILENDGEYDDDNDKENRNRESGAPEEESDSDYRQSSVVALGTRRGFQDCALQIACGGDNGTVVVYD